MGIYTLIISDYIIPHSELFTAARRNSWPIPSIYELICVCMLILLQKDGTITF